MKKLILATLGLMAIAMLSCSSNNKDLENKGEATLLVTFGSSYKAPRETYAKIEKTFATAYPDQRISWTYTSSIIRKKLAQQGIYIDAPDEALEKLARLGYKKINVQSLHVIPGREYDEMIDFVNKFKAAHSDNTVKVGAPLFDTDEDMREVAEILHKRFQQMIEKGEAIVFMGHGTEHAANDRYARINKIMKNYSKFMIVGTVESDPSIDDVIAELKETGATAVTMMPLMSVAGDHATNDMAGDEDDSWKTLLTNAGYTVSIDKLDNGNFSALGDIEEIRNIWLKHMKATSAR